MKWKFFITVGSAGALALSIGFAQDLQSKKVLSQSGHSKVKVEETVATKGDQNRVISVEEQNRAEGNVKNVITIISVKEQNIVENSSAQQGFVAQENGTGFFFKK